MSRKVPRKAPIITAEITRNAKRILNQKWNRLSAIYIVGKTYALLRWTKLSTNLETLKSRTIAKNIAQISHFAISKWQFGWF